MKSTNEHIPFLDYLRGLAILSVFLCHAIFNNYSKFFHKTIWNGWLLDLNSLWSEGFLFAAGGVAIFFVVSGFCVHLSHERSREKDLGVFYLRRFFRIYPPYLLALLIFTFVYPNTRLDFSSSLLHTRPQYVFSSLQLLAHMALVHNLSAYTVWNINGIFWSIGVEVQLYLLYPLLLFVASRLGWIGVLWMTAAIELGLRSLAVAMGSDPIWATGNDPVWLTKDPLFFWYSWAIGAALADAYLKGQTLPFQGRSLLFFPVLALISGQFKPLAFFTFPLIALSTAHYISHWLRNPTLAPSPAGRGGFFSKHLCAAGVVSYSFYLLHGPLLESWITALKTILGPGAPVYAITLLCLTGWFLILIPSYFYYRFVELPGIAWGKWAIAWRRRSLGTLTAAPVAVKS